MNPRRFDVDLIKDGAEPSNVSLMVNLSGTMQTEDLPPEIRESDAIYTLKPATPHVPGVSVISSPELLSNFAETFRAFLADVEANHSGVDCISLFVAAPVSAAITMGRVLISGVSPALRVFDRDDSGIFFKALEVRKSRSA